MDMDTTTNESPLQGDVVSYKGTLYEVFSRFQARQGAMLEVCRHAPGMQECVAVPMRSCTKVGSVWFPRSRLVSHGG